MKTICDEERRLPSREYLSTAAPILQKRMSCMEDLPVDVMVDILSRLAVKTIIHCKCVCKQWQKIIFDSYFADVQLSKSPARLMIYSKSGVLNCLDVEDHHNLHHHPVMNLNIKFALVTDLVGSVNGLICLWQLNKKKRDNTYICNPITREYMILPRQHYYRKGYRNIVHCFGVSSRTLKYKVIRIFQSDREYSTRTLRNSEAEVYTLGTGQWRSLGHVPYCFKGPYGVFLNGHAHWTIHDEKIYAFDFEKETFELFPSPPSRSRRIHSRKLDVIKGCLCLSHISTSKMTIWVMKEYGIEKSWHKEIVIRKGINPNLDHMLFLRPPHLLEGFKDGTILMASLTNNHLLLYYPWSKTIIDTEIFDDYYYGGFAYRPSFHRLHNFENERVKSVLKLRS